MDDDPSPLDPGNRFMGEPGNTSGDLANFLKSHGWNFENSPEMKRNII